MMLHGRVCLLYEWSILYETQDFTIILVHIK